MKSLAKFLTESLKTKTVAVKLIEFLRWYAGFTDGEPGFNLKDLVYDNLTLVTSIDGVHCDDQSGRGSKVLFDLLSKNLNDTVTIKSTLVGNEVFGEWEYEFTIAGKVIELSGMNFAMDPEIFE